MFDKIGGDKLLLVVQDFYDRVFDDVMIGFLFIGKDKQRLIQKEWELAAKMLGADVAYTGRPIREAHAKSPILGGHFERRLQILKDTCADHDVDPDVVDTWVSHTNALRSHVTRDIGSECDHSKNMAAVNLPDD